MLVSGKASSGQVTEAARVIGEQAASMTRIMRQLLDFARRRRPQKTNVDLGALARRTITFLEPAASKRGVGIELANTMQSPLIIPADAGQIEQVLTNLVMNAIDASKPEGKLTIEVRDKAVGAPPGSCAWKRQAAFCCSSPRRPHSLGQCTCAELSRNVRLAAYHRCRRVSVTFTLRALINDGLMAIFFFVVGMEIKRETRSR